MAEPIANENTSESLHAMLAYKLGWQEHEISDHLHLIHDLYVDSLDFMEIEIGIDEVFGVRLSTDALQSVETVGDLRIIVEALMEKPGDKG
jgi:acyl carrier protein